MTERRCSEGEVAAIIARAAVAVSDRPEWSMKALIQLAEHTDKLPDSELRACSAALFAERKSAHPRMDLGKRHDGSDVTRFPRTSR